MRGRILLALALLALITASAGAREAEPPLRPCRRVDLLGHWLVLRFGFASGSAVDRSDAAYQPYQRYVFNADATMIYAASATPPDADQEQALLRAATPLTWALEPGGRLRRQRDGAARVETSECRVVMRAVKDSRNPLLALPGDVMLTDQDEAARPVARRLLRRLPSGE